MPPKNNSLEALATIFRVPFEAWLEYVSSHVTHVNFVVTETLRTYERQQWLYKQGRTPPYENVPEVTWTLDSRHRWGLAADIAMIRKETGAPIWEISSWQWLYRAYPLEPFGLKSLAPREYVHIELFLADDAIREARSLGLRQV